MGAKSKESKHRDQIFSALNVSIDGLDLAEKLSIITPAKAAFGTVGVVLKMIRVRIILCCEGSLWVDNVYTGYDDQ